MKGAEETNKHIMKSRGGMLDSAWENFYYFYFFKTLFIYF